MDVRVLRYFVEVASQGSVSRAARALNIAQPGLSTQMRNLESELGVELFVRHPKGVTLTESGRVLNEHAQSILRDLERTKGLISDLAASPRGVVRLGLPTTVTIGLAGPLYERVTAAYPDVSLEIVEAMSGSLSDLLRLGELDLALLFDSVPRHAVLIEPLVTEDLFLLVAPFHRLAGANRVTFREMAELELVLPSTRHTIRRMLERVAEEYGCRLNVVATVDSLTAILAMAERGVPTIMPYMCAGDRIRRGDLCALMLEDPPVSWSLHTVSPLRGGPTSASLAVNSMIRAVTQDLVSSGAWPARLQ